MARVRTAIDWSFDLGDLGMRNGRVLADVEGAKVTLISATIGDDESNNILPSIRLSTRERIKQALKDYSGVSDAVYDWDGPSAS